MSTPDSIRIRGARQHNLKNVDCDIPRNKLVVITGVSGSGKSSLAFDTLFAEGQRRYLEALSTRSRPYLQKIDRPDVDEILGLSPAIAIEQKRVSRNPRSTVGTLSEIHDYLRVLFSVLGTPHCLHCGQPVAAHTVPEILQEVFGAWSETTRLMVLAPLAPFPEKDLAKLLAGLRKEGFARIRMGRQVLELDPLPRIPRHSEYRMDLVVDRLVLAESRRQRFNEAIELALKLSPGFVTVADLQGTERTFSDTLTCHTCRSKLPDLSPSLFSFHHPSGMCQACNGLGYLAPAAPSDEPNPTLSRRTGPRRGIVDRGEMDARSHHPREAWAEDDSVRLHSFPTTRCPACGGSRLNPQARSVRLAGQAIHEISALTIVELLEWASRLIISDARVSVTRPLLDQIIQRAQAMERLGLGYLSPDRSAATLSGGEAQRVRLAQQIGSQLTGLLYVLDEPSIGLHPHDQERLLDILRSLRDAGNTVLVVEHDRETILASDHVVDMGPGAGKFGGQVLFSGPPAELLHHSASLTGHYLAGEQQIPVSRQRQPFRDGGITLKGACGHNLKNIDVRFPLKCITCVTGVSGSGKSTLVLDTLYRALAAQLHRASAPPAPFTALEGVGSIQKVLLIDQSPIGRTPRSTPATYTAIFTTVRQLFAKLPEARARGYHSDRFSYNIKGGRCESCKGDGILSVDLVFLPDVTVTCPYCGGTRYNPETLQITFKGHSVADILSMTISEALPLLENIPTARRHLQILLEVGLGYLTLGQSALTLSGGEAQRVKLAAELCLKMSEHTVYILDEPTTGLHFDDVSKLLTILHRLAQAGHTIILIEHHPDVILSADYVVDLGPGAGASGGNVVAVGSPDDIMRTTASVTGRFLLRANPRSVSDRKAL